MGVGWGEIAQNVSRELPPWGVGNNIQPFLLTSQCHLKVQFTEVYSGEPISLTHRSWEKDYWQEHRGPQYSLTEKSPPSMDDGWLSVTHIDDSHSISLHQTLAPPEIP